MNKATSTRKPHSKSRKGCVPCKRRRVKCDEQGPPCVNCVVRHCESDCYYIGRSPAASPVSAGETTRQGLSAIATAVSTSTNSPVTREATPPTASEPQDATNYSLPSFKSLDLTSTSRDRNVELELMRQWCTKTHLNTARVESDIGMWLGAATDLAFKHSFLMDMILAMSSLQLAHDQSNREATFPYVNRALQYQDTAMTSARAAATDATGDRYIALYCFSVLNMAFSMVSPQLPTALSDTVESPIQSVLVSFQHVVMMERLVSGGGKDWIDNSPFGSEKIKSEQSELWQGQSRAILSEPLHRLRTLVENEINSSDEEPSHYQPHLDAINWLFRAIDTDLGLCIVLLAWAGWSFVEDIKKDNHCALLILMHWGVTLNRFKLAWWAQFVSVRVVDEVSKKLKGRKSGDWDSAVHWCRATVGLPLISMQGP